jgi:hypothetical protein
MDVLNYISVIVPVGPTEQNMGAILRSLSALPRGAEIIFCFCKNARHSQVWRQAIDAKLPCRVSRVFSEAGRARQQNVGAKKANRAFLLFLHVDSELNAEALDRLAVSIFTEPEALHYFDLRFLPDGPSLMRINEAGVWLRSHLLGIPFGDQGFCLSRASFFRLLGFDEETEFGEDHLLVWKTRRAGIRLCCSKGVIATSARKYAQHGWGYTTLMHGWLTARQAIPEAIKLLVFRNRPKGAP